MASTGSTQKYVIATAILNALKSLKLHLKVVVYLLLCCALFILSYFTLTSSNSFHCVIIGLQVKQTKKCQQSQKWNKTVSRKFHVWHLSIVNLFLLNDCSYACQIYTLSLSFYVFFIRLVLFGFGLGNRTLIDLFSSVQAERQNTASVGHYLQYI